MSAALRTLIRRAAPLAGAAFLFYAAAASGSPVSTDAGEDPVAKSVVRIFVTAQKPDFYQPWQMQPQENVSGSGCILEGHRILTNAHVVSDAVYIQVRKAGDPRVYDARVEFVAHDAELALLRVEDPDFFKGTLPLPLGELPRQRDPISVYGFPEGGEDLSVTDGIISRIEVTEYTHSNRYLLTLQTDAAINPGNSGGPAVENGKLVGVSFQYISGDGMQSTGYLVPVTLIRRFLKDVSDGTYDGVPLLGVDWQELQNSSVRSYVGLKESQSGVLVNDTAYGSAAAEALKAGDVITAVDGISIADDGTYELREGQRLEFSNLFAMHQMGDRVRLSILRDGKPREVSVVLKPYRDLVDDPVYDVKPTYYIFAGLVFTPLTPNYMDQWSDDDVPTSFRALQEFGQASAKRRQAVVLAYILPHEINAGYFGWRGEIISEINGTPIGDMKDVITAFQHPLGHYHVIRTAPDMGSGGLIVIDADRVAAAQKEILERHGIPSDRSEDLR